MDQQNKIYAYSGITLSNKQKQTTDTHNIMDEFQTHVLSERS